MRVTIEALLDYYSQVYDRTFRDLPIVNTRLDIEAVGFRPLDEHAIGALITPWFLNLVLLPGTDRWDEHPQGSACQLELPGSKVEFRVSHEENLGTILSAALFSTVADFPEQALAHEVAQETLRLLFDGDGVQSEEEPGRRMSRRALLRRLGGMAEDSP
jgi:[NiFe] hydrogenase assembly HybE family chaperone